jgi:hypothetical protein
MSVLASLLPLAQESGSADIAEEGRNIIIVMLLTGLTFIGVIALGQLARFLGHRRQERRDARRRAY